MGRMPLSWLGRKQEKTKRSGSFGSPPAETHKRSLHQQDGRRKSPFQAALATLVNGTESGKFGGLAGRLLDGPVHLPSY